MIVCLLIVCLHDDCLVYVSAPILGLPNVLLKFKFEQVKYLNPFTPGGPEINHLFYASSFYWMISLVCGDPITRIWIANMIFGSVKELKESQSQGVTISVRPFVPNLSRALILHLLASDSSG